MRYVFFIVLLSSCITLSFPSDPPKPPVKPPVQVPLMLKIQGANSEENHVELVNISVTGNDVQTIANDSSFIYGRIGNQNFCIHLVDTPGKWIASEAHKVAEPYHYQLEVK